MIKKKYLEGKRNSKCNENIQKVKKGNLGKLEMMYNGRYR